MTPFFYWYAFFNLLIWIDFFTDMDDIKNKIFISASKSKIHINKKKAHISKMQFTDMKKSISVTPPLLIWL
jgi:hypothetical protein